MNYKVGFIGCGNMGGALLSAVLESVEGKNCLVSELNQDRVSKFIDLGVKSTTIEEIAKSCEYIVLAVKPQVMKETVNEVSKYIEDNKNATLITIAAGIDTKSIEEFLNKQRKVIRIMPNLPCQYKKGVILYCHNKLVDSKTEEEFKLIFSKAGLIDKIAEDKIDIASVISGCGPAFVYMFAESLADAAAKCGLDKEKAVLYAVKTLEGASVLMQNSDGDIPSLIKAVCSPKGTTIEGVESFERDGFRKIVENAVTASYKRSLQLKEQK